MNVRLKKKQSKIDEKKKLKKTRAAWAQSVSKTIPVRQAEAESKNKKEQNGCKK